MKTVTFSSVALLVCCATASAPRPPGDAPVVCQGGREGALVDGRLHIRPGETLCILLRRQGDAMVIDAVVTDAASPGVLTLQASSPDFGTLLVLKSSLSVPLKYRAWLRRAMGTTYAYTSSCPIEARSANYESWPDGIDELVVADFKVAAGSGVQVCN